MIRYEEYLLAVGLTLARRHRPVWSHERRRVVCRCGSDMPCRSRRKLVSRDDWPAHRELSTLLTVHTKGAEDFCTRCRMGYGLVAYPCQPVRVAVRTFGTELAERLLDGLR